MTNFFYKISLFVSSVFYSINSKILYTRFNTCGSNVSLNTRSSVCFWPEKIDVGNNVFMEQGFHLSCREGLLIGNNFMAGTRLTIIGGDHDFSLTDISMFEKSKGIDLPVVIQDDVWCGANVTILKGVTLGTGCVIGAGAIVTKNTLPYGIYVGNPAKLLKMRT